MGEKKYVFLNHPLSANDPNPPAIPAPEFTPFMSLDKGDEANVTNIKMVSHTGTHVDSPCHVIKTGITITDFRAEEFMYTSPVVFPIQLGNDEVVMPVHLEGLLQTAKSADLILFKFGYGAIRRKDSKGYSLHSPGFGVESASFLAKSFPRLRAIGMDVPSLACIASLEMTMKAHNILLAAHGGRFLVIEDMDLDKDLSGLQEVIVAPWLISKLDGGPATVFGVLD